MSINVACLYATEGMLADRTCSWAGSTSCCEVAIAWMGKVGRPVFRVIRKATPDSVPMTKKERPSPKDLSKARKAMQKQKKQKEEEGLKQANEKQETKKSKAKDLPKTQESKPKPLEDKKPKKSQAKAQPKTSPPSILKMSKDEKQKPLKRRLSFAEEDAVHHIKAKGPKKSKKDSKASTAEEKTPEQMSKAERDQILKALEESAVLPCFLESC